MRKIKKLILIIVILILNITVFPKEAKADVGSFESYDSGSDWGSSSSWGSSWDSSSTWGSDSSAWKSSDSWFEDSDDTRKIYLSSSSKNNRLGNIILTTLIITVIIFLIRILIIPKIKKIIKHANILDETEEARECTQVLAEMVVDPEIYQGPIVEEIKSIDPLFDKDKFNKDVQRLFINMQNAWTQRDWQKIREFETDDLYEQHRMQIDGYIKNGIINILENICVHYSKILSFELKGDKEALNAVVKVTMSDYIIDEKTKKIIRGNKEQIKEKFYKLEFIRKEGVKTKLENEGIDINNCPNCGAPIKINNIGECEYCRTIITNGDFGWILNNYEPYKLNN